MELGVNIMPTDPFPFQSNIKGMLIASGENTCIASNVVDKEPNGLSSAWTTAGKSKLIRDPTIPSPNCWMEMHQTAKLQIALKRNNLISSNNPLETPNKPPRVGHKSKHLTFILVPTIKLANDSRTTPATSSVKTPTPRWELSITKSKKKREITNLRRLGRAKGGTAWTRDTWQPARRCERERRENVRGKGYLGEFEEEEFRVCLLTFLRLRSWCQRGEGGWEEARRRRGQTSTADRPRRGGGCVGGLSRRGIDPARSRSLGSVDRRSPPSALWVWGARDGKRVGGKVVIDWLVPRQITRTESERIFRVLSWNRIPEKIGKFYLGTPLWSGIGYFLR